MTTTIDTDSAKILALAQGINLADLRKVIPMLEESCKRKIAAKDEFKEAIDAAAERLKIIPAVLSQYITARCNDTVEKKAQSAAQLNLLFAEID